jgi:hypothetical protein
MKQDTQTINLNFPSEWRFLAPIKVDQMIRIGRNNDGGYVVPIAALKNIDALISMGIFNDWSFDLDLQKHIPDIEIHAYDHTISKQSFKRDYRRAFIKFIKFKLPYQKLIEKRNLYKSYCSFFNGKVKHYQERIHNRLDNSNDATLNIVFQRIQKKCIFLKIDIEGSEYRLIDEIIKFSDSIQVLIIEFHDIDPLMPVFFSAIKKLQEKYDIVHFHANNYGAVAKNQLPEVVEITFTKKGLLPSDQIRYELPLDGLDYPCNPNVQDYQIHFSND